VNDVYGGTNRYFTKVASLHGVEATFVNLHDPENLKSAMRPNTKMVWIETPSEFDLLSAFVDSDCT
jgi:cystathionine gamma-lyase